MLLVSVAGATIRYVPQQYPTIQAGINAAVSGDTVLVAPGVYVENVQMANGVKLFGSGMDKTIVDGGGLNNVISSWYGVINVFIQDLSVRNSQQSGGNPGSTGIFLNPNSSAGSKFVLRCHIYNCGFGIQIWNDFGGTADIEDNVINDNLYDGFSPYLGTVYLRNNTIVDNGRDGYNDWSGGGTGIYVQNNIIAHNARYGIYKHRDTPVMISYNDVWNNTGGAYYEGFSGPAQPFTPQPGTGEIAANPLFIGPPYLLADQYYITWANFPTPDSSKSPCIDAGNPLAQFNDPDGTRGDMGALIFDQRVFNVEITLAPVGLWVVPPGGGNLDYMISLTNHEAFTVPFDSWVLVTLPNGSLYGPVQGPVALTMPAGVTLSRLRSQSVPAAAPPGQYLYMAYAGLYPNHPWDFSFTSFTKQASLGDGGSMALENWICTESEFVPDQTAASLGPAEFTLYPCSPNPFNPITAISFKLQAASHVSLKVFDISGKVVATLVEGWRQAGTHEVTFDGTGLAAGMYLSRLEVNGQVSVQKMALVK
jgi:hypothetical protein